MNPHGIVAIYKFEMARWGRTLWQSLITPVITTALYFVVFGTALGSRMTEMEGVSYGSFIVPGLTLLSVFMAFNVWVIIWPNQKKVLGLVAADDAAKAKAASTAGIASRLNVLLSIPMLLAMTNMH